MVLRRVLDHLFQKMLSDKPYLSHIVLSDKKVFLNLFSVFVFSGRKALYKKKLVRKLGFNLIFLRAFFMFLGNQPKA